MPEHIGLFGGTFNPVHIGHKAIAESFLKSGLIDELWVLLTPFPPHKTSNYQVNYHKRLEMLEAAFSGIKNLQIKTFENDLPKPSYSVHTVRFLKDKYPEKKFFYCIGEDSLVQFHKWKNYEEILEKCDLLVAERPGFDHSNVQPEVLRHAHFVEHTPLAVSSTSIREKIKKGVSIQKDVPENVRVILERDKLY